MDVSFLCPKCSCSKYTVGELRASGGAFSSMNDIDNAIFTTVSCTQCGYTEFFKGYLREVKERLGME